MPVPGISRKVRRLHLCVPNCLGNRLISLIYVRYDHFYLLNRIIKRVIVWIIELVVCDFYVLNSTEKSSRYNRDYLMIIIKPLYDKYSNTLTSYYIFAKLLNIFVFILFSINNFIIKRITDATEK